MNKPWWLWEGAAVRDELGQVGICEGIDRTETAAIVDQFRQSGNRVFIPLSAITPIDNPAVRYAPPWAACVHIRDDKEDGGIWINWLDARHLRSKRAWVNWPQCPDHLRGKTWPLPGGEKE
jgi:hypothetical protein